MSASFVPAFGRRATATHPRVERIIEEAQKQDDLPPALAPLHNPEITDLREACLSRLDPNVVSQMTPERLTVDVERLISEIATERRVQLNARNSGRWPASWCTISSAWDRWNRCWKTTRSPTSW